MGFTDWFRQLGAAKTACTIVLKEDVRGHWRAEVRTRLQDDAPLMLKLGPIKGDASKVRIVAMTAIINAGYTVSATTDVVMVPQKRWTPVEGGSSMSSRRVLAAVSHRAAAVSARLRRGMKAVRPTRIPTPQIEVDLDPAPT